METDNWLDKLNTNFEDWINSFNSRRKNYSRYGFKSEDDNSSLKYQLLAILLITAGVILVFQSFGQNINVENIVTQTKLYIDKTENTQIESDLRNLSGTDSTVINMTAVQVTAPIVPSPAETATTTNTTPAAAAAKKSTAATSTKDVVVKSGDTLYNLAKANNTTVSTLKEINGLESNNLKIGSTLKVPLNPSTAKSKTTSK
ncbi:MAG: hypothetical protein OHK0017_10860 [Patescibacteria group bacterium]